MQPSQTLLHDHQKLSTSVLNTTKNQKQLRYFVKVKSWTLKNSVLDSNLLPCPRIGITNDYEHNGRRKRIIWFTESTNSCKTLNLVMALKNKKGQAFSLPFFFPLSRAQNNIKGQKEIILLLKSEGFFVKDYGIWKGVEFSGRALSNVHTFCMYLLSLSLSVRTISQEFLLFREIAMSSTEIQFCISDWEWGFDDWEASLLSFS